MKLENYMCIGGPKHGEVVTDYINRKVFYAPKFSKIVESSKEQRTYSLVEYKLQTFGRGQVFYRIWVDSTTSIRHAEDIIKKDFNG